MFEQLLAEVFNMLNSSPRAVFKQVVEQRLNVKTGSLEAPPTQSKCVGYLLGTPTPVTPCCGGLGLSGRRAAARLVGLTLGERRIGRVAARRVSARWVAARREAA